MQYFSILYSFKIINAIAKKKFKVILKIIFRYSMFYILVISFYIVFGLHNLVLQFCADTFVLFALFKQTFKFGFLQHFFVQISISRCFQYGEIEEMNVCDHLGDHLVGNVYVKFRFEEDAEKSVNQVNNRWYNGKNKLNKIASINF